MIQRIVIILLASSMAAAQGTLKDQVDKYQTRYNLNNLLNLLVNNTGDGYEDLYGTRNFRVVLNGVAYRGGANNFYHRTNKRDNRNPLPNDGLENLCREGFSEAFYMYSENYTTAPQTVTCTTRDGLPNTLKYSQVGPYNQTNIEILLRAVANVINNPGTGPIYMHCWNGWHASGMASAYALKQFCDFTGEEAVEYWDLATDGRNQEPVFEKIRDQLRAFKSIAGLTLSQEQKALICPPLKY